MNRSVHPYTQVMARCLGTAPESKVLESVSPQCNCDCNQDFLLANMLQGRLLAHMKERICGYYHISVDSLGEEFDGILFEVFQEDLFGLFRKKIEQTPSLVPQLSKKIVEAEMEPSHNRERRLNHLYLSIFCKYLGYKNIRAIFDILEHEPRIQEYIVSATSSQQHC